MLTVKYVMVLEQLCVLCVKTLPLTVLSSIFFKMVTNVLHNVKKEVKLAHSKHGNVRSVLGTVVNASSITLILLSKILLKLKLLLLGNRKLILVISDTSQCHQIVLYNTVLFSFGFFLIRRAHFILN